MVMSSSITIMKGIKDQINELKAKNSNERYDKPGHNCLLRLNLAVEVI